MPRLEMRVGQMTPPPIVKTAPVQISKPAAKRVCCKTCKGLGCTGHCKF